MTVDSLRNEREMGAEMAGNGPPEPATFRMECCDCAKVAEGSFEEVRKVFAPRPGGRVFFKRCRICARLWVAAYRKTEKYAEWKERTREQRREKARKTPKTPASRARYARYYARAKSNPQAIKARNLLTSALERGDVKRGTLCANCGDHEHKLRAYFHRGHANWRDVTWLCYRCTAAQAHKDAVADNVAEERRIAPYVKDKLLAARKLFLVMLGYTGSEADDKLEAEGWFRKGPPPLECVLGCWVPYEEP